MSTFNSFFFFFIDGYNRIVDLQLVKMEEDTKKISFGFKLVSKPKVMQNLVSRTIPEKAVDFIECVEEKAIKVIGLEETHEIHELVIPLQPSFRRLLPAEVAKSKQNCSNNKLPENGTLSLDEMAVQALLSGCQKTENDEEDDSKTIDIPMKANIIGESEMSKLEDYNDVPVDKFGLAMLRGMGWESTKGIGKNPKLITSTEQKLRPKGMGLGADQLLKKNVQKQENTEEELKLKTGAYVQILLGRLDGQYGQIIGFDEGASMVMVKITRTGQTEKINENTFSLVTKQDYDKNSRVINIKKYKDYHEGKMKTDDIENRSHHHRNKKNSEKDVSRDRHSRHHKTKKSKHSKSPHRKHKSDHNSHKKYKHKRSSS